jgi:hypothetical protein
MKKVHLLRPDTAILVTASITIPATAMAGTADGGGSSGAVAWWHGGEVRAAARRGCGGMAHGNAVRWTRRGELRAVTRQAMRGGTARWGVTTQFFRKPKITTENFFVNKSLFVK